MRVLLPSVLARTIQESSKWRYVGYWHLTDIPIASLNVRFWG